MNPQTQFIITLTFEVCVIKFMFIVISGSPSSEVCCFDPKYSGVIGILPDRLTDYSVEVHVDDS